MRINVYAEEIHELTDSDGDRVLIRETKAKGVEDFRHFGVMLVLGKRNIHTEINGVKDDDSSGVTFWFSDRHQKKRLLDILKDAINKVEKTQTDQE